VEQPALTRKAALAIWWALVLLPVAFLVVILGLEGEPQSPELRPLFFWLAVGASVLDVVLSRVLAPRVGSAATSDPEALAFTRLLLGWALCEAAALFPLVAYLITGDGRLLGVFAVDLLALVLLFPSAGRIESLMRSLGGAPTAGRMVR
jgi:F0F1-type ATP synthase membrane subunit c/vacuolar-type H+-ATPase subunit K